MTSFTAMSYDQRLETILAISASGIVFCGLWIVWILVKIEATKTVSFAVDDDGDIHNLDLQEEMEDGLEVEVEKPPSPKKSSNPTKQKKHRYRRVSMAFKVQQTVSVLVLILLTYLLLVVSAAPMWLSAIGSFCVFGVFLKYQIGDELRRARLDRLTLMVSLFLMIASLLSLGTYTMKSLKQGEIYEGPARIVGYDVSTYNNSKHDPSTRADLMVQWGKAWACPLSGGKVCQAHVSGAMCSANTVGDRRRRRRRRHLADNLEAENEKLEKQNEELEEEVEELKEKQGNEEEEEELEVEAVEVDENEVKDEYDEEEKEVEEEEVEEEELDVVDEEYMEEEVIEYEEEDVTDDTVKQEYDEVVDELDESVQEVEEEAEDEEEEYEEEITEDEEDEETQEEQKDEITDEIFDAAEQVEDEEAEVETTEEAIEEDEEGGGETTEEEYVEEYEETEEEDDKEEIVEEEEIEDEEAIEEEYQEYESEYTDDAVVEELEEDEEIAEEEIVNEYENEDDWYWDEITTEYDDDLYENEYWEYDWDSAWGEYACEDLFDSETSGFAYDQSTPAGTDDYPFINIYGSCKTCEAYILDYFAEEAFEKVDDIKKQAVLYFTAALAGFGVSFIWFLKYKVSPTAENEIELLGYEGGVIA